MGEENQVTKEPQPVTKEPQQGTEGPAVPAVTKEPQRVTTKDPKKVEAGKRLAAINHKKREAKRREEQVQLEKTGVNQYYGIRVVIALGAIGGLGYYIYRFKKGGQGEEQPSNPQQNNPKPHSQTNKLEKD